MNWNWVTFRKCSIQVQNWRFFCPITLEFWRIALEHNRATSNFVNQTVVICEFKLELWSGNAQFLSKSTILFDPCDLGNYRKTLQNNRLPLTWQTKLCASFYRHFDLRPWPFAWTSFLSMVLTPENFMIQRWGHSEVKKVWRTDRRTDGQTDGLDQS